MTPADSIASAGSAAPSTSAHDSSPSRMQSRTLLVAALGVVFGDIGTSPLYAFAESVHHLPDRSDAHVYGVLSLFFWSLVLIVAIKYVVFICRADNHGEGGILALLALVPSRPRKTPISVGVTAMLVIFGTALLYGDGVITPAISVLSAVEGLKIVSDAPRYQSVISHLTVPITCVILLGLFAAQRGGTAKVGRAFGPVMVVWFATLAVLGAIQIAQEPGVFAAISPHWAMQLLVAGNVDALAVLGAVVLCVTGSEALYADMGHFGRGPIRFGWFWIVMPALLLNYFGQGALALRAPEVEHTFWGMVSEGPATVALVALSTAATVIASQALITGCYSLTRQAVQLGYFPRVRIIHTSRTTEGQIYVPSINWALAIACLLLVVAFGSSSKLAAAYGIAVTGTMLVTSIVYYVVVRRAWQWSWLRAAPLVAGFVVLDGTFLGANLVKVLHGGWVPLLMASVLFLIMLTWKQCRALLHEHLRGATLPLEAVASGCGPDDARRVSGTGVFMAADTTATPLALLHFFKHAKVLPETVLAVSVQVANVPWIPKRARAQVQALGNGFWRISLAYGFMQSPNIPIALDLVCEAEGIPLVVGETTYFVGREHFLPTGPGKVAKWRKRLFEVLSRNVPPATDAFGIPPGRVVELGAQVAL
jgi:KUP system potassium uptake protein